MTRIASHRGPGADHVHVKIEFNKMKYALLVETTLNTPG